MAKRPKIWIRTCRHDGIQWWVPDHLRKVRAPGWSERLQAAGEPLVGVPLLSPGGRGANVRLGRLEQNYAESIRLGYCPYCRSADWDEHKTRDMPEPVEQQIYRLKMAAFQRQQQYLAQLHYQQQLAARRPPPPRQPPPPQLPPPPGTQPPSAIAR